jgi:uncharacterized caspase-like protein
VISRGNDDVTLMFAGLGALDASGRASLVLAQPAGSQSVEMLAIDELLDVLLKNNPRTLTLVLDCSFAAPGDKRCATTAELLEGLPGVDPYDAIIKSCAARGTTCVILAASSGNAPALEIEDLGHGLFTSFALEAMGGAADSNRDRQITASEFRTYVRERVSHIAGLEGATQTGYFHVPADRAGYVLPSWHR